MEFSFTGEAARDRYCRDHSSHTLIAGGASSRIPRALNITPSSAATPSGQIDLSQTACEQLRRTTDCTRAGIHR
jgi:hypothetical protein